MLFCLAVQAMEKVPPAIPLLVESASSQVPRHLVLPVPANCRVLKLENGQILNVIDTPGLFDFSDQTESFAKEIIKCIDLAKDGIHAVIVVFSVAHRFSQEEKAALCRLYNLFGREIIDYMIVVFTGGDILENDQETLEDYLDVCPKPLKNILDLCKNRRLLFNNMTKDETERVKQVQALLSLVNVVLEQNDGKPYTHWLFAQSQKETMKLGDQQAECHSQKKYEDLLAKLMKELKEATKRLEKQLEEEKAARRKAEERAQADQKKSNDEIRKLRKELKNMRRDKEEHREKQVENGCIIL